MTQRVTTRQVKERVIWAAEVLLKRAGMDVVRTDVSRDGVTLRVHIPADSKDPHGDRLRMALAEE